MNQNQNSNIITKIANTKLTPDHYYYGTVIAYFITSVIFTALLGLVSFVNTPQGFIDDIYLHGRDRDEEYKNSTIVSFVLLLIQTFVLSVKLGSKQKNIFIIVSLFISFILLALLIFLYIIPENNRIFNKDNNTQYNYPAFFLTAYLALSVIYILIMYLNKKTNHQIIKNKFMMSDLGDVKKANIAEQRFFFPLVLTMGALLVGYVGFLVFCIVEGKYLFEYHRTNIPSGMGSGIGKT